MRIGTGLAAASKKLLSDHLKKSSPIISRRKALKG
jgi:hypothetical protein